MITTKETLRAKIGRASKRWGCSFWLSRITILIGLVLLLYYGYCWGWWGRGSLLLQYLFQCSCPPASEEARYPRQVEVIVSACPDIRSSRVLPSGRFLFVYEKNSESNSAYRLDLRTMERVDITSQPFSNFLTDDLWFVESGLEDSIIDQTTGRQYPIRTFRYWRENAYVNGEPNLGLLLSALHQAEQVFLTPNYSTVVVLMPNYFANPAQRFTFDLFDFPMWSSSEIEQLLRENNITFQTIPASYPDELVSPDGRFVARADGIYLYETNQKIVDGYSFRRFHSPYSGRYLLVRGWTDDGTGVVYSQFAVARV